MVRWGMPSPVFALKGRNSDPGVNAASPHWRRWLGVAAASSGKASVLGMKNTRAPVEEKLLVMMREILKNNGIRAEDNFFLFGGHSLLAMQLVMRVRDTFGVDMTLRQFFESPTVERLAVLVETILIENISSMTDEEAEKQLTE